MKRPCRIAAFLLAAVLALAGCAQAPGDRVDESTPSGSTTGPDTTSQSEPENSQSSQPGPSQPQQEEEASQPDPVLADALEAYGWFVTECLPFDPNDQREPEPGIVCYRVTDERFPDYESFHYYLLNLFADDIIQHQLMAGGNYLDLDGLLYTRGGSRGADIFIAKVEYLEPEKNELKEIYPVQVSYVAEPGDTEIDRVEEYRFVREKHEGVWRFVEFPYFY